MYGNDSAMAQTDSRRVQRDTSSVLVGEQIRPNTKLEATMGSLASSIGTLSDQVNALSARLNGVLQPQRPRPVNDAKGETASPSSPAVEETDRLRTHVEAIQAVVVDLLERLEA